MTFAHVIHSRPCGYTTPWRKFFIIAPLIALVIAGCMSVAPVQPRPQLMGSITFSNVEQVRDASGNAYFVPCNPCESPTPKTLALNADPTTMPSEPDNDKPDARGFGASYQAMTKQTVAVAILTPAEEPRPTILAAVPPVAVADTPAAPPTPTSASLAPAAREGLRLDPELASVARIVPFAFSASTIGPRGRKAVAEIVPLAKQAQHVNVRGRTDDQGDAIKNRLMAQGRATSVMYAFAAAGVPRSIIKGTYCSTCYIASNTTDVGRRANRRVEIDLVMPAKLAVNLPKPVYSAVDADDAPTVVLARADAFNLIRLQ